MNGLGAELGPEAEEAIRLLRAMLEDAADSMQVTVINLESTR